jgi:mono/diheme cytochrome c family protein
MNSDEAIDKALEGVLSNDEWQALICDHTTLKELEQHLGMDALLRVALEKNDTSAALSDAIEASVKTSSVDDLMRGIEAATIGRRRQRRWLTSLPHWTTAAAAILIGLLGGTLAWPDIFLRLDLGPTVAQRTGKHVILHGHIIAKPPAQPLVVTPEPILLPPTPATPAAPIPPAPDVMVVEKTTEPVPSPLPPLVVPPAVSMGTVAAPVPSKMETASIPPINLASLPKRDMPQETPGADAKIDFERHILPIFERSCFECHSGKLKKPKGGIRLDDLEAIREKSQTDNLVLPHKASKSALVKSISLKPGDDDLMPPPNDGKPLSADEIALIRRWVEEGANFGSWTSMQAKEVSISTLNEAVDVTKLQAVAARIDQLIEQDLSKHAEEPRPLANEFVWLRRVYLDLVGRIPTSDETKRFITAKGADKRGRLIDELLASNGHISHMFNYWCDLLRAKDDLAEGVQGDFYLAWIKQSVRNNTPFDEWTRELLSPEGYGWRAPAAGYYLRDGENRAANIESTATLFLGTQISCAQCHDHPYSRWTRKDYHQFLAWTSGITTASQEAAVGEVSGKAIREAAERYNRMAKDKLDYERRQKNQRIRDALLALQRAAGGAGVVNGEGHQARLPDDYQYPDGKPGELLPAAVLYGESPPSGARPAETLAAWVTSPNNTRFALTLANRLWAKLFGLPFAGRVDQVREIADCANPDLAQYLVNVVRDSKYDVRQILQIFCLTHAYQREAGLPPQDVAVTYRFPGPVLRRLTADQVWDSMMALAVKDLDVKLNFDPPGVAELEAAVTAKKASEVTAVARKIASKEERAMKLEERRVRLRKEMAREFAGGGLERASELPQPTPDGHFLRMFGQGNREFIGDAWSSSTVPQALLMLNSDFFDHVARSGSPLSDSLKGLNNVREVARGAFLAVLTREPTQAELDACKETLGDARNAKALARTLLSTAEFMFQK